MILPRIKNIFLNGKAVKLIKDNKIESYGLIKLIKVLKNFNRVIKLKLQSIKYNQFR